MEKRNQLLQDGRCPYGTCQNEASHCDSNAEVPSDRLQRRSRI